MAFRIVILRWNFPHLLLPSLEPSRSYCNSLWQLQQHRDVHKNSGWKWKGCQKPRQRWIHIQYPPRDRSTIVKLHENWSKLLFVCNGYIARMDPSKLSPKLLKRYNFLRRAPVPINDRRLRNKDVQDCITRTNTPCVAFTQAGTHQLIEAFSMQEIYEIEKLIPKIREAFEEVEATAEIDEAADAATAHECLSLKDLNAALSLTFQSNDVV